MSGLTAIVIAIDTNLLVYTHRAGAREHNAALAAMEQARNHPAGWGVAFPVLAEFYSVITGGTAGARPATVKEAAAFVEEIGRAGGEVWFPAPGMERNLADLARQLDVRGPRIFDLQIAFIARENGASELWTHDAGFITVPGLRVRDPLAA